MAFSFCLVFLLILWVTFFSYLISKNYFGHTNYYGQPVGTFLLLPVLIVATGVFIFGLWKYSKGEDIFNKNSDRPEYMEKPPFKWPWE